MENPTAALPPTEDSAAHALDAYLAAVEAGTAPPREQFLEHHPQLAEDLDACLAALRFIGRAAEAPRALAAGAAAEPLPEAPPGQLGDFRLLREVGRGGMGVVYEAEQVSLGRRVALKVLPFAATMDPRQLKRFHNEARAAAALDHPHIVPVHAVGCERAVHFYAMQFIDGQTLADLIRELRAGEGREAITEERRSTIEEQGLKIPDRESRSEEAEATAPGKPAVRVPQAETREDAAPTNPTSTLNGRSSSFHPRSSFFQTVARLGIQAAEALDHAHQLGVLHRDVKPANLLVDSRGQLWVTDFGLAHMQSGAHLTMTGDLVGTLRYMSPEQALAKRVVVDHRTDVYSLGATLYELLTLEPAFGGNDRQELLRQIAFEDPRPPRRWHKAIPAELETIVQKAMEKQPRERYATAAALAEDLRRFLDGRPTQARPIGRGRRLVKWARRRPMVAAFLGLLVVALTAAVAGTWIHLRNLRDYELAQSEGARQAALARERLRFNRALKYGPDIAELGKNWNLLSYDDRRQRLDRLRPGPGEPDPRGFEWFYLRQAVSGQRQLRPPGPQVGALCYSPHGRRLAALTRRGIEIWDAASGRLSQRLLETGGDRPLALRFSPDGRTLVSVAGNNTKGVIKVWDLAADRTVAEWTGRESESFTAAISPNGRTVALGGTSEPNEEFAQVQLWDVGSARPRVVWQRRPSHGNVTSLAFAPDGRLLAVGYHWGPKMQIDLLALQKSEVRATMPGHRSFITALTFSPDGSILASGAGDQQFRLWNARTGHGRGHIQVEPNPLKDTVVDVSRLAFSPDGRMLAAGWQPFWGKGSAKACSVSLWDVVSWKRHPLQLCPGSEIGPLVFSPDRRTLAVACGDGQIRLWDMVLAPPGELSVPSESPREAWSAAFSPDGQTLAVGYDDEHGGDRRVLQLWDLQTGSVRATLTGHASMVFAVTYTHPDGQTVISAGHDHTVRLWDAASGKLRRTLRGHTDQVKCLACSPDGRTLATSGADQTVRLWDLATGKERPPLRGHTAIVDRVVFAPDGKTVVSASADGTARIWDVATGATIRVLDGATTLTALAYAPDGRTLATADKSGVIRLWDPVSGMERARLEGHAWKVHALVYSPDGKTLASGGADLTVRLWQAATGRPLLTFDDLREYPHDLAFSSDGRHLAAALHDGRVRLWHAAAREE
jgi:WD40 repeat protein/serine/threonine protein kinase